MADGQGGQGKDGAGDAGTGWGTGHTWEETGPRPEGGAHMDAWREGDSASDWEEEFQDLYDAQRLRDTDTLLTSARGRVDEDGHIDTLPIRLSPGDGEQVRVPELDMPEAYRQAAADALQDEAIPPGYREQVKQYFDAVEGSPAP